MICLKLNFGSITNARGLGAEEKELLELLLAVYNKNYDRNIERTKYYEGKVSVADKNLGIAVPSTLSNLQVSCCWPQKTVEALQSRSVFDGFVSNNQDIEQKLAQISERNGLRAKYSRAVISELIHGCAFATVTASENGNASIRFRTAEMAAAIWDGENERIKAGFVIIDTRKHNSDSTYVPCLVHMHTEDAVIILSRDKNKNTWNAEKKKHAMGRPMMEPLVYRPSEGKPFGKSRITRPVMALTDSYMREMLRMEVGAELFTSPQKAILGADEDAFEMDKYAAYITNMLVIGKDEDGDVPTLTQLNPASMQPHIDVMRNLATQFAGATCVPVSELGVISDNPSSAEAIYAAKEALVIEAESSLNASNAQSLKNIALMALAIEENTPLSSLGNIFGEDYLDFTVKFMNPAMPSVVSQADAMTKIASVAPWIAESEVFLEEVGFDEGQRKRLASDKVKNESRAAINAIFGGDKAVSDGTA